MYLGILGDDRTEGQGILLYLYSKVQSFAKTSVSEERSSKGDSGSGVA